MEQVLSAGRNTQGQWILDSGATCHMCNKESMFTDLHLLHNPLTVMLGDGRNLQAVGRGKVIALFILGKTIFIGSLMNVTSHPDCHSRAFGVPSMQWLV